MSEQKSAPQFTPGPWQTGETDYIVRASDGNDGASAIADCGTSWTLTDAAMLANTHLIAAAPDGYAAAEQAIEHMEWSTPQGRAAYEALVAFTRKARGEQ